MNRDIEREELIGRLKKLAHQLVDAAYTCGFEDAYPQYAWTKAHAAAKSAQVLTNLLETIDELTAKRRDK